MNYRDMLREYAGYDDDTLSAMSDEDCAHEWEEVSTDPTNYELQ